MKKKYVVALGEVTGHSHRFECDEKNITVIDEKDGLLKKFKLKTDVEVEHEEHKKCRLGTEFGNWTVGKVQEFDFFADEVRKVMD